MVVRTLVLALSVSTALATAQPPGIAPERTMGLRSDADNTFELTAGVPPRPFLTLLLSAHSRPVVWPLHAPCGVEVTRSWPMREQAHAERDHPHQKSMWFAHGDVGGVDFWSEAKGAGRIVYDGWNGGEVNVPHGQVRIASRHRWVDADGALVCRDRRELVARVEDGAHLVDLAVTVAALPDRPLRFGDTKEGTMGLRLHPALRLEGAIATGHYLDSEGRRDRDVWGKRARWVACTGEIDGEAVGLVLMDHPGNLRHPCWWHARPYGLLAANPFGAHDFEGAPKGTGDFELRAGGELPLRYRVLVFDGARSAEQLEAAWRRFAAGTEGGR